MVDDSSLTGFAPTPGQHLLLGGEGADAPRQSILSLPGNMPDMVSFGAYPAGCDPAMDKAVASGPRIGAMLRQEKIEQTSDRGILLIWRQRSTRQQTDDCVFGEVGGPACLSAEAELDGIRDRATAMMPILADRSNDSTASCERMLAEVGVAATPA